VAYIDSGRSDKKREKLRKQKTTSCGSDRHDSELLQCLRGGAASGAHHTLGGIPTALFQQNALIIKNA